jgi:hypothetical protein
MATTETTALKAISSRFSGIVARPAGVSARGWASKAAHLARTAVWTAGWANSRTASASMANCSGPFSTDGAGMFISSVQTS